MRLVFIFQLFFASLALTQCSDEPPARPEDDAPPDCIFLGVDTCKQKEPGILQVDLGSTRQTIHSFGASDCWTAKFIGKWTDKNKKDRIADLLFSTDTLEDGSPEGIGLSLWRFNIGAGSFEQGDESNITTDWRREESFQLADGSYDWSKQAGQQWFLNAARERGVKYTLGFSLSAPVHMTQNGKEIHRTAGTKLNIKEGLLDDNADFMVEVSNHFGFDFLSPINEPQWAWGSNNQASQEGTQARNTEIAELSRLLSQKFEARGSSTEIVVGEAGSWTYLYTNNTDGRGDQITQFFWPASGNYIGDQNKVAKIMSGHSYWTTCPDNTLVTVRQELANKVKQVDPDLQLWQTEFGILGDICGQYNGSPRNTTIDYGLYVARVIHPDLAIANVSSWQWWLAISPYNYSDALVYINDPSGNINVDNCKHDGIVLDSKQLWCFGNFSRFIRPGMVRVSASITDITDPFTAANSLMVSAYKDETDRNLVIVLVNFSSEDRTLKLDKSLSVQGGQLDAYTTSATESLKRSVMHADDIQINRRSVVTLVTSY